MTDAPSAEGSRGDRTELVVSAILVAVGAVVLVDALRIRDVSVAEVDPIGPKPVPIIVAIGLFACAILLAVDVLRGGHGEAEEGEDVDLGLPIDWRTVGLLIASFVLNIALIDRLGWVISGGLLFYGAAFALGSRHYVRDLVVAGVLSVSTFYAFYSGLVIELPAGVLQGIL